MSSIVGILSRSHRAEASQVERALSASPHRGSLLRVRTLGNCALGISNADNFVEASLSREGEVIAVFHGKLDNAEDLVHLLNHSGHAPLSSEPADIVVAAVKAFGTMAPRYMRGAFSGIATDGQRIWCFRDPIALKPLFYRNDSAALFAATEAKQIISAANLKLEPDLAVVEQTFYGRMSAGVPCAVKGVSRLPQSTTLTADIAGCFRLDSYWDPAAVLETAHFTAEEMAERFHSLMAQAVRRTLTGKDVIMLSGGIDSPTVAAFAAPEHLRLTGRPLHAISAVYPTLPKVDESTYIKMVADYLDIESKTYVGESRPLEDVAEWCRLLDGPCPTVAFADMRTWYTRASELGFGNILTGEYAEFLFTLHEDIVGHLLSHRRWSAVRRLLASERAKGRGLKSIVRLLAYPFIPGRLANWYHKKQRLTQFRRVPEWIDLRKVNEVDARPDLLTPISRRWSELQVLPFQGPAVTTEADELCATLSGVSIRRPFADIDLWEFFLSLPAELKFPDLRSKTLIRKLMRGKLPDPILDRRDKTVFDDYMMSHIDYPSFKRLIYAAGTAFRMDGVDYSRLEGLIDNRSFNLIDWYWANDLARAHAFLNLWSSNEERLTLEKHLALV